MEETHSKTTIQKLIEGLARQSPFHKTLGLTEESFDPENETIKFPMKDELMRDSFSTTLHGGLIAALMDIEGVFLLSLDMIKNREAPITKNEMAEKAQKSGTVDMRIDYLLPGKGEHFTTSGTILRMGNQLATIHTELHNEKNDLISTGTATYRIG